MSTFADAVSILASSQSILVFTGAGISTESGIPDFRGPNGVWNDVSPAEFTLSRYVGSQSRRERGWQRRFDPARASFAPNPAHAAIARLWEAGKMVGCVTQNIDGLHQQAGVPAAAVAELHGNAKGIHCLSCSRPAQPDAVRRRWERGELDPDCEECGGILKPTVVYFGEALPAAAVARSQQWADEADAVLAVGTTLAVYPAAEIPLQVATGGHPYVIVNKGATEHDMIADLRLDGMAGTLLPQLVDRLVAAKDLSTRG